MIKRDYGNKRDFYVSKKLLTFLIYLPHVHSIAFGKSNLKFPCCELTSSKLGSICLIRTKSDVCTFKYLKKKSTYSYD